MQTRADVPFCLRHAREEMLMALGAPDAREEVLHRRKAKKYVTNAVRAIQRHPGRSYDWSELKPHAHHH